MKNKNEKRNLKLVDAEPRRAEIDRREKEEKDCRLGLEELEKRVKEVSSELYTVSCRYLGVIFDVVGDDTPRSIDMCIGAVDTRMS